MRSREACLFILTAVLPLGLFAAEGHNQTDGQMQKRFSEVQEVLGTKAPLRGVGTEVPLRSDFGTPVRTGVVLQADDLKLMVDAQTGMLISLDVKTHRATGAGRERVAVRQKAEALALAVKNLQTLGSDLGAEASPIFQGFDAAMGLWRFAWERRVDGYPFPEETLALSFDDSSDRIVSLRDLRTTRQCPTVAVVSNAQARAVAEAHVQSLLPQLFGKDYAIAAMSDGKLTVVYPNSRYQSESTGGSEITANGPPNPHLVFVFDITFQYTGKSNLRKTTPPIQVWVDAQTGQVVGGL